MIGENGEKALVSVIVPFYNSKKYLNRCIESFSGEGEIALQIILVDDGSTDGSHEIAEQIAAEDSRVKLITLENGGVSRARNTGLLSAVGRFVMFVDSDDWMAPGIIKELVRVQEETEADLVMCELTRCDSLEQRPQCKEKSGSGNVRVCKKDDFMKVFFRIEGNEWVHYPVAKLYKRELLPEGLYPEKIRIGEDVPGTYRALQKVNTIARLDKVGYFYFVNPKSATSAFSSKDFDLLLAWDTVAKEAAGIPGEEVYAKLNRSRTYFTLLLRLLTETSRKERKMMYKEKEEQLRKRLKKSEKALLNSKFVFSRKVLIFMMCHMYPVVELMGGTYYFLHKVSGTKKSMMNR